MVFGNYSAVGQRRDGMLKVDGNTVAIERMEHTLPFIRTFGGVPSVTRHRSRRAVDGGRLGRTSASRR
jgi:hypothetical protein